MTVMEPVGRPVGTAEPTEPAEDVLPAQRDVEAEPVVEPDTDAARVGGHQHTRSCYWDLRVAGWECPTETRRA